jgi:hypothetical protein
MAATATCTTLGITGSLKAAASSAARMALVRHPQGWPTMSLMAKLWGMGVFIGTTTLIKARSVTATPAWSAANFLPLGA